MYAKGAGRSCIGQVKVEVEDVLRLDVQFTTDEKNFLNEGGIGEVKSFGK